MIIQVNREYCLTVDDECVVTLVGVDSKTGIVTVQDLWGVIWYLPDISHLSEMLEQEIFVVKPVSEMILPLDADVSKLPLTKYGEPGTLG